MQISVEELCDYYESSADMSMCSCSCSANICCLQTHTVDVLVKGLNGQNELHFILTEFSYKEPQRFTDCNRELYESVIWMAEIFH